MLQPKYFSKAAHLQKVSSRQQYVSGNGGVQPGCFHLYKFRILKIFVSGRTLHNSVAVYMAFPAEPLCAETATIYCMLVRFLGRMRNVKNVATTNHHRVTHLLFTLLLP